MKHWQILIVFVMQHYDFCIC